MKSLDAVGHTSCSGFSSSSSASPSSSSFFFFFSPSSSSSFLPSVSLLFLGCVCWFTTSLPGVVSHCRGACVAGHVPSSSASASFFFFSFFFFALSSSSLLFFLSPSSSLVRVLVHHVLTWGGVTVLGCVCFGCANSLNRQFLFSA